MSEIKEINYEAIFAAYDEQAPVEATVLESTGKGFFVDVFGLRSFLPGSETADKENVGEGDVIEVVVLKVNAAKANVIVSNRVVVERRAELLAQKALSEMEVGDIVQGVVKNITNYGAFISVGPIDGLVHVNELSWQKFTDVNNMLKIGDVVKAKIISIDERKGTKRLGLSIKQCEADPWEEIKPNDYVGHVMDVVVSQVMDYGIFVNVGMVDGLIHQSELSWATNVKDVKPSEMYSVGDKVTAKVVSCDASAHKMALSIKAVRPDPWEALTDDMKGKVFDGLVINTAKFGAFVEIMPNVEGLVHVSDLSWAMLDDASDYVSVGERIQVRVDDFNRSSRKLSLNHKVLIPNPWDSMELKNYLGRSYQGVVTRVKKDNVYVRFAPEMVGKLRDGEAVAGSLKVGDSITVSPDFIDVRKKAVYLKLIQP